MNTLLIECNRTGTGPHPGDRSPYGPYRPAQMIARALDADSVWQSPLAPVGPVGGYDALVFHRALPSVGENAAWLDANPDSAIYHITNDYSVEGTSLYVAAQERGRHVHAIANFPQFHGLAHSHLTTNLNALLFDPTRRGTDHPRHGCVYYGYVRPDREALLAKYLTGYVDIFANESQRERYRAIGVTGPFVGDYLTWDGNGLHPWSNVLCLVDAHPASPIVFPYNRFYEALSWEAYPVCVKEMREVIDRFGYDIPRELIVDHPDQIPDCEDYRNRVVMDEWRAQAVDEQANVLREIALFVRGNA